MLPKKMPTKVATRPPKPPTSKSRETGTEEKFRAAIGKAAEGLTALVEKGRAEAVAKASRPKKPDLKIPDAKYRRVVVTITVEPKSFAETGRDAAKAAQKELLLITLGNLNWNLTKTAEALEMGARGNVIRALKTLAPFEYEQAKEAGLVKPGVRPEE